MDRYYITTRVSNIDSTLPLETLIQIDNTSLDEGNTWPQFNQNVPNNLWSLKFRIFTFKIYSIASKRFHVARELRTGSLVQNPNEIKGQLILNVLTLGGLKSWPELLPTLCNKLDENNQAVVEVNIRLLYIDQPTNFLWVDFTLVLF